MALGSVVFARSVERSLKVLLAASTFAVGFAYLGWWLAPTLALASAPAFVGGVGNGVQWAALISAVQRLTPENLQGRLMGAVESIGAIFPAFGYALGSAITVLASPRIALLVAGVGRDCVHRGVRAACGWTTAVRLRRPLRRRRDADSRAYRGTDARAHDEPAPQRPASVQAATAARSTERGRSAARCSASGLPALQSSRRRPAARRPLRTTRDRPLSTTEPE